MKHVPSILIVEDDAAMGESVVDLLRRRGLLASTCADVGEALSRIEHEPFDVVVSDLNMPSGSGLSLSQQLSTREPNLPVVLMTAFGSVERAIEAMRSGAFDFLLKPFEPDELFVRVQRAIEHRRLSMELQRLRASAVARPDELLGDSAVMQHVLDLVARVAKTAASVLITGETGTGKELLARAIHDTSEHAQAAFVAVNCAAVPEALLESELFGHVRGAFTDAHADRKGLFARAHGGTLFLDEIGDMPLPLQVKLLRVLQQRRVRPVGSDRELEVDVRVISATHRDLESLVAERSFREDLYYRLNVVQIELPPLRARGTDVLSLAQLFVAQCAARSSRPVTGFDAACAQRLMDYPFPGNVRELRNAIERATAMCQGSEIRVTDLPAKIQEYTTSRAVFVGIEPSQLAPMSEIERGYVLRVLDAVGGNKSKAAQILGFDRKTLYAKLRAYGVLES
jgi:two-component system response regulator HydG